MKIIDSASKAPSFFNVMVNEYDIGSGVTSIPFVVCDVNFQVFVIRAFLLKKVKFGPSSYFPHDEKPAPNEINRNE
jgi:hypothetical protein